MGSTWLALRADLRVRWRAMAGLALLLGLIGGVVLTAAAGARRTDTAYPRLLQWANAAQVDIMAPGTGLTGYYAALARLPQAAAISTEVWYQMAVLARHGVPEHSHGPADQEERLQRGTEFVFGPLAQHPIDDHGWTGRVVCAAQAPRKEAEQVRPARRASPIGARADKAV